MPQHSIVPSGNSRIAVFKFKKSKNKQRLSESADGGRV
jgi:hypothetical protein